MRNFPFVLYLFLLTSFFILPDESSGDNISFQGDFSLWWDIYEETENYVIQPRTGKPAADGWGADECSRVAQIQAFDC